AGESKVVSLYAATGKAQLTLLPHAPARWPMFVRVRGLACTVRLKCQNLWTTCCTSALCVKNSLVWLHPARSLTDSASHVSGNRLTDNSSSLDSAHSTSKEFSWPSCAGSPS